MKRILILGIFILLLLLSVPLSCSEKMDSIIIAYAPFEGTALIWIAEEKDFFKQNGIDTNYRKYETGAGALEGMLKDEADIVVGTSSFPLVIKAFNGAEISTFGSIAKSDLIYIIGRKDHGIENPSDLQDKIVGTTYGTIAEYYLGRFLQLNGIDIKDLEIIDLKTSEEWVDSIVNGVIDAVSTAQPYAFYDTKLLGNNATVWPAQSGQLLNSHLIAKNEWIADHPEMINRLLKSLLQAEKYAINNPTEVKTIVTKRLELDPSYLETVWTKNQFSLSLEHALILAMEDQARWMIENNLVDKKQIPNFLDYIYEDGLRSIKPEAVNIIR